MLLDPPEHLLDDWKNDPFALVNPVIPDEVGHYSPIYWKKGPNNDVQLMREDEREARLKYYYENPDDEPLVIHKTISVPIEVPVERVKEVIKNLPVIYPLKIYKQSYWAASLAFMVGLVLGCLVYGGIHG